MFGHLRPLLDAASDLLAACMGGLFEMDFRLNIIHFRLDLDRPLCTKNFPAKIL